MKIKCNKPYKMAIFIFSKIKSIIYHKNIFNMTVVFQLLLFFFSSKVFKKYWKIKFPCIYYVYIDKKNIEQSYYKKILHVTIVRVNEVKLVYCSEWKKKVNYGQILVLLWENIKYNFKLKLIH